VRNDPQVSDAERRIVPIQEAADAVGRTRQTLYRYIRLGLLKRYRVPIDRRTYIDLDELEELMRHPPFHEAR
jgi:predicted site-specific integrase-resolvase